MINDIKQGYNNNINYNNKNKNDNNNNINPVKGDVLDSTLNVGGGQFDTNPEMNEGAS